MTTYSTSGHVCGNCGQWISVGMGHACGSPAPRMPSTVTWDRTQEILDRLDRILAALDKLSA